MVLAVFAGLLLASCELTSSTPHDWEESASASPVPAARPTIPGASPSEAGPSQATALGTPTVATSPPCIPGVLAATAGWQGATGSIVGTIRFHNVGSQPCQLRGHPKLDIVDSAGRSLQVEVFLAAPSSPPFRGDPEQGVDLRQGEEARTFVIWRNWCGARADALGPLTVELQLPGSGGTLRAAGPAYVARCDAPGAPSSISVGAFAPAE
jgi:hypothetical protein